MMRFSTRQVTLAGMFIALGVLFPILFHAIGAGSIFLPMFWPVALATFYLSVPVAAAVALITPLLSTLLTGMPPLSPPIMHLIMVELTVLAGVTGYLHHHHRWSLFWSLTAGLFVSRIALFIATVPMAELLGLPPALTSGIMVVKGLPGIVLMLFIIPVFINRTTNKRLF
jgi:hypothetical protein